MSDTTDTPGDLRAAHAALTRERILAAAIARFAPWSTEMPFDVVAARAGVSTRTVYRHFPTQLDLVKAVAARLIRDSGWQPEALTADTMGAMTAQSFEYFGTLLEAAHHPEAPMPPGMEGLRKQRLDAFERAVAPLVQGMDPELARGITAVFAGMARVHFLRAMHEHHGLSGPQAGRAVAWAMDTLVEALRNRTPATEQD